MHRILPLLMRASAWMLLLPATVFGVLVPESGSANQDYLVRVWGADEGLPVTSVTDMAQTPEGYLWISTLLAGVVRFDGAEFVCFNSANTPELKSMGARSLMVDREGMLWVAMYSGALATWTQKGFSLVGTNLDRLERLLWSAPGEVMFVYSDGRLLQGKQVKEAWHWEAFSLPDAATQPNLCANSDGGIWYIATNHSIRVWQNGQIRDLSSTHGLEGRPVTVLAADSTGRLWAGSDQALACWRDGSFEIMTPTNGEPVLAVKRIIAAGGNYGMWVEANNRMRRCERRSWVAESEGWVRELGQLNALRFVRGDSHGGLWAGQATMGLMRLEADGHFQRLTTRDGLPSDYVRFVFSDREGNAWTGYERGSLVQVRPRTFRVVGPERGLGDSLVTTVCEDREGAIWMGTLGGSVALYRDGQCTNYTLPQSLHPANSAVTVDGRGQVWVTAGPAGLFRFEHGEFRRVLTRQQIGGDVRLLLPARDGRLWLATLDSIFVFDGQELTLRHHAATSRDNPCALTEAPDGTIWFGTIGGSLFRANGAEWERLEPPQAKTWSGRSWSICAAKNGSLWIGTSYGGLLHFRNGVFRRFTTKDGLPSDTIVQVLLDTDENLWLVTGAGVVRITEAVLARFERGEVSTLSFSVYGRADGLLTVGGAIEFQPNCFRARDGTLWFAMVKGAASVKPDEVRINPLPPTVAIEEVLANNHHLWPAARSAVVAAAALPGLSVATGERPVVRVEPGRRDVEVHYTGLSLTSPERVRFKHRLRGLDDNWTDAGNARSVTYNALPPGHYTFEVIACNSDGIWNAEAVKFSLEVEPHYYETKWFIGGLFLITVAVFSVAAFVFARRRAHWRIVELKRQGELERERTRIAQDIHDDLGAGLTRIAMLSQSALDQTPAAGEVSRIYSTARAMAHTMDEIVWAINPGHDTLESVAAYFGDFVEEYLNASGINIRLEIPLDLPPRMISSELRHNLFLAFKESLNNVVKHAQAREVVVSLSVRGDALSVVVADDGCGFNVSTPPAHVTGYRHIGRGNGLNNLQHRLAALGGRCEIESVPGHGTRVMFEVKLPP